MMIYALDNLHTYSIVMNQTTGALNRNIEKLLQERHDDKQKISSMNFEMIQLQLKNTAASMKVNKLLDEIGSLKKKLLENQAIVPDLNASTKEDPEEDEPPKEDPDNDDQVEEHTHDKDIATADPVQEMQLKMMWLWRIQNKGMQLIMIQMKMRRIKLRRIKNMKEKTLPLQKEPSEFNKMFKCRLQLSRILKSKEKRLATRCSISFFVVFLFFMFFFFFW
ncbi:unnamed protein product [Malus baccata var. baccata]